MSEAVRQIDEHRVIRDTIGYDQLKNVSLEDMPNVLKFLKIVDNYNRIHRLTKDHNKLNELYIVK